MPSPIRTAPPDPRRLVGRDDEIASLLAALDAVATGTGRTVALVGEPGIGKSALMSTVTVHARAAGFQVVTAHGGDAAWPAVPRARPTARGGEPRRPANRPHRGAGVLVAVDDLHHLPADRIADVERLIADAAAGPVLCLLAYRQRQLWPALAAVLSRAASGGTLGRWNLGPLSREQSLDLVGPRPDADEIYRAGAGNPQYMQVIAADGAADTDVGTAILGELAALDPAALTVVQAAAVLGEPFDVDLLAAVAGLGTAQTEAALDRLSGLDLVRRAELAPRMALRHRAVAEVVHQRIEPSRRIALHRAAVQALADRAAPIGRRAHHVAQSAEPGRQEHVTTMIAAARDSLHTSPAVAADYLRAALSLLEEGQPHWHEAQVALARARLLVGEAAGSRALLDALRAAVPGQAPPGLDAVADASRAERWLGRYSESGAIARAGLADLADSDSATAAALHTELADYAYDHHDYVTSRRHAETAAAIARRHHDRVGEAHALAQASLAHLFNADQHAARTAVARAADLLDATPDATLLTHLDAAHQLGMAEGMMGRLADAERHLTRGAALSRRTGQTYIQPALLMTLANTQLRAGHLRHALATLDEAAALGAHVGQPANRAVIPMLRSETLFWLGGDGDLPEVVGLADRAAALADGQPTAWAVSVRCFHAQLVLLVGDPARARWLLLEAVGGTRLPRIPAWRKPRLYDTLVQAALAEDDRTSAEHWAALSETCVDRLPSPGRRGFALRARMRTQAAYGETGPAVVSAREAIADFAASCERIEVCRTLLAAASLSLDAGRTHDVSGWLDRASTLARQCGSARLTDEVAYQRARFTASAGAAAFRDTLAALTVREREIAELASTGRTSGDIARTLFLSVRTVDSHLSRIYRKLDVSNRAGLTRTVLNHGATGEAPTRFF